MREFYQREIKCLFQYLNKEISNGDIEKITNGRVRNFFDAREYLSELIPMPSYTLDEEDSVEKAKRMIELEDSFKNSDICKAYTLPKPDKEI